jgi:hypothetical protein
MDNNLAIYEAFTDLLRNAKDLTIWAGNKCINNVCPDCLAYWRINQDQSHIWIRRDLENKLFIYPGCTDKRVGEFVNGCLDYSKELSLLSHEYGHYSLKHNGQVIRQTVDDCRTEFQIEVNAWNKGEQTLAAVGFGDWKSFKSWKKRSLDGYYDGFKAKFQDFTPTAPYDR